MPSPDSSVVIPLVALGAAAITGLFTVLGVSISTRSSSEQLLTKLSHEEQVAREEALRTRLEELYQLIDQWASSFAGHHVTFRRVMEGVLTYNQALDLTISSERNVDAARMLTLAELYFPECHAQLEEIKSIREDASQIQAEFKEQYRHSGTPSEIHARRITEVLMRFNATVELYKKQLSEYVRAV